MKTEQVAGRAARNGFKALDPAQMGGLSSAERDAIARTIVAEGPALIEWGHTERLVSRALLAGVLAAAAVLVVMVQSRKWEAKSSLPALAVAVASSCNADAPSTPIIREGLDRTNLALQARNLGGGTVWIDTPQAQVRTTRSLMRIVSLAQRTSISVVDGEVVMRTVQGPESVGAGRAVKPAPYAPTRSPVPTARAEIQSDVPAAKLLSRAEALWRKGNHAAARLAFRAAANERGPIGEAAWVRLARLELSAGSSKQALKALNARKDRAEKGMLGAEALWLEAEALEGAGRSNEAVSAAEILLREYPTSPQAPAARQLLAKGNVP